MKNRWLPASFFFLLASSISLPSFPQHPHPSTPAPQHNSKSDWHYYQTHGHKSEKWNSLVEAGFDTFESGNLDTAQNFLQRAQALGCKDGLVLFTLAQIIEAKGNLRGALDLYTQLKPVMEKQYTPYPETKSLSEHIAGIYYQLERYDDALPLYLEAIQKQGENFIRLYLVGQIYRIQEKPKEAIGFFEKALNFSPPPEAFAMKRLAQVELMRLYYAANLLEKCVEVVNAILNEDHAHPEALRLRDQIRLKAYQEKERKSWEKMLNK